MSKNKKQPKHNVVVSERARQMLRTHMRFLAKASPDAADKLTDAIDKAICSLDEMPGRFPFFDGECVPREKYRRMVVYRRYLVLYRIQENTVLVDSIFDGREDFGWLID